MASTAHSPPSRYFLLRFPSSFPSLPAGRTYTACFPPSQFRYHQGCPPSTVSAQGHIFPPHSSPAQSTNPHQSLHPDAHATTPPWACAPPSSTASSSPSSAAPA